MSRRVLRGPAARAALLRGMHQMTRLLRPTLGPVPRTVAIGRLVGSGPPEVLDNAAIIARRTLGLADPFEDMGAMLVRHLVWRVHERTGDGGATAAVLADGLVQVGTRYLAAGGEPVAMRRGIQRGLASALEALQRQVRPLEAPEQITALVYTHLGDAELASVLGEAVDSVGTDGAILVEDSQSTRTTHEYVDGVRWNEGFVSSFLLPSEAASLARVLNPRVLVTDHILDRAEHLLPTLEACVQAGVRNLLVIAPEVRDAAVGVLVANRERGVLDAVLAVKAPSIGDQRAKILDDLAVITGGRCISNARGERLADVRVEDLGAARQAWATRMAFGILGGHGSRAAIRQRIAEARAELAAADDPYTKARVTERIGKLAGITVVVRVGASTTAAQEELKLRIEAAVGSARAAVREGVVPGGGAALLACRTALAALDLGQDERVGVRALDVALAEPMRCILSNAGYEPAPLLAGARPERAFDVLHGAWIDPWRESLLDPVPVVRTALQTSMSAAMNALLVEVLVHRPNAPTSTEP